MDNPCKTYKNLNLIEKHFYKCFEKILFWKFSFEYEPSVSGLYCSSLLLNFSVLCFSKDKFRIKKIDFPLMSVAWLSLVLLWSSFYVSHGVLSFNCIGMLMFHRTSVHQQSLTILAHTLHEAYRRSYSFDAGIFIKKCVKIMNKS